MLTLRLWRQPNIKSSSCQSLCATCSCLKSVLLAVQFKVLFLAIIYQGLCPVAILTLILLITTMSFLARLLILIEKSGILQLKFGVVGVNIYLWRDNLISFSCIIFKFVMHVTNKQFSNKFNNDWKKVKMADLLSFFAFYFNNLTLWPQ